MSPKWVRRLSLANIIVNVAIVVTGGAVRLTGSGLGCPSWPNCAPGTFHATPEMGMHGAIEWGNRLFGAIVALVAIVTFVAALLRKPKRASLVWLTGFIGVAVAVQAFIGAATVGTDLSPWMVSVHFLVSIAILAAALVAWVRAGEPDGEVRLTVPKPVRSLWWVLVGVTVAVLFVGTLVTGAGPHAGDKDSPRSGLDTELISQAHADLVFLLVGVTIGLVFTLRVAGAPAAASRRVWVLIGVIAAQGLIGFVQYFTDLPAPLVGAHLLGAAVLWLTVLWVGVPMRERLAPSLEVRQRPAAERVTAEATA
ncbi:COX15/CtaA family protein [Stackebrandtia nassauensis]|uniref:COX15/CtaA family protein n=1 Tax=Stackebrandtia nassauensis TaxID=283811 RepID=UPI001B7F8B62|nr:COX15/CtaA family protein [Stackebrandtia nassauensis]